jgi:hypothetical protein
MPKNAWSLNITVSVGAGTLFLHSAAFTLCYLRHSESPTGFWRIKVPKSSKELGLIFLLVAQYPIAEMEALADQRHENRRPSAWLDLR